MCLCTPGNQNVDRIMGLAHKSCLSIRGETHSLLQLPWTASQDRVHVPDCQKIRIVRVRESKCRCTNHVSRFVMNFTPCCGAPGPSVKTVFACMTPKKKPECSCVCLPENRRQQGFGSAVLHVFVRVTAYKSCLSIRDELHSLLRRPWTAGQDCVHMADLTTLWRRVCSVGSRSEISPPCGGVCASQSPISLHPPRSSPPGSHSTSHLAATTYRRKLLEVRWN